MKKLFLLAAAALALASCSNDDNQTGNWDGRLRLSSGVAMQSRAAHGLDEVIAKDETVWLYIDNDKSTPEQVYGKQLTATGSNGFTGGDEMYFPAESSKISLYAFHINEGTSTTMTADAYPTGLLTHQIEQDQTSGESKSGYAKSDLLYATCTVSREDAKTNTGKITLPFVHLLSKIEVVLVQGKGEPDITKMEILNTRLQVSFTPGKAATSITLSAVDGNTDSNPIVIDCGTTSGEAASNTENDANKVLNEAVIVPQTLNDKTPFIRLTLQDGGILVYKLEEETTFVSGYKYRYTITANLTDLSVSSSITPWTSVTNKPGTATME
jgi:hypothetical protein